MAARTKRIWTPQVVRDRIRVAMLVNRLHACAAGEIELTSAQLKSIEILLKKAVPDLRSIEHSGHIQHTHASQLTDEQLAHIAAGGSLGTAATQDGEAADAPVH